MVPSKVTQLVQVEEGIKERVTWKKFRICTFICGRIDFFYAFFSFCFWQVFWCLNWSSQLGVKRSQIIDTWQFLGPTRRKMIIITIPIQRVNFSLRSLVVCLDARTPRETLLPHPYMHYPITYWNEKERMPRARCKKRGGDVGWLIG